MISGIVFILIITASAINCQNVDQSNSLSKQHSTSRLILFWGPSIFELDSTMNDEESEVYSDYYYYITQAVPFLRRLGIELKDTTTQILKIEYDADKTETFHREQNSIGYIFTDGVQKPMIIRAVMTDEELVTEAKNYFNLK